MRVPAEVRWALNGTPRVGAWNDMIPFLTVDEHGYPHVCLLSRAELSTDEDHVYAVVASPTSIANLTRSGQSTLVVITDAAALYVKLDAAGLVQDQDWLGMAFTVAHVKSDGIGVPLAPPRYLAPQTITTDEDWDRSAQVLQELEHRLLKETK